LVGRTVWRRVAGDGAVGERVRRVSEERGRVERDEEGEWCTGGVGGSRIGDRRKVDGGWGAKLVGKRGGV